MVYRDILQEIKKGTIYPIYLLYGTEQLLIQEIMETLEQRICSGDSLNSLRFDCDETPIQVAVQEAETLPFFGDRRMVTVRNASLFTGARSSRTDHDINLLLRYLENPAPTSVLVLIVNGDKIDERKKITKAVHKNGKIAAFLPLKEQELRSWVQTRANRLQVSIAEDAVIRLVRTCGTNLVYLASELDKLSLYVGEKGTIDGDIVNLLASRTLEQDIFVFVDEVVRMRTGHAMQMMEDLLKSKQAPIYLLFMIARQIRMMLQMKIQSVRGFSSKQIASQIGAHPYACQIAGEQAKKYSRNELEQLLAELGDIDYKIKTGKMEDRHALEMFVLSLPRKVGSPS